MVRRKEKIDARVSVSTKRSTKEEFEDICADELDSTMSRVISKFMERTIKKYRKKNAK